MDVLGSINNRSLHNPQNRILFRKQQPNKIQRLFGCSLGIISASVPSKRSCLRKSLFIKGLHGSSVLSGKHRTTFLPSKRKQ